jgi:hypothetical protein
MVLALRRISALAFSSLFLYGLLRLRYPLGISALIASLIFFIAECFNHALTLTQRFGIVYLAVIGFIYSCAGVLGLMSHMELIEALIWTFFVSPYVWITLLQSHGGGYDLIPNDEPHRFSSAIVLALGLIAVGAAFAMSRSCKIGYQIWMALLGIMILLVSGYVLAAILYYGSERLWVPLAWLISCMVAFALAYRGSEFHSTKSSETL